MAGQQLPNPTRYVTENDEDGKSFFSKTIPESVPMTIDLGGGTPARLMYTAEQAPAQLTNNTDIAAYETSLKQSPALIRPGGGPNVWFVDTAPEAESPMHRTLSLDFVIQLVGELELTMSNGEKRSIKPGDVTVQRSTMHKWRNPSKTQWSRMVAVATESQPVITKNAGTLEQEFH